MSDKQQTPSAAQHDAAFGQDHPDAQLCRIADENVNGEYGALDASHPRYATSTAAGAPSDALPGLSARDAHEHAKEG